MATRMQQRRGTAAQWTSANPVLVAGEIGFETDTNKFKIGDDSTTWSNLPYFTTLDDIVDGAPGLLDTLNELAAAIGDDENFVTTITSSVAEKLPLAGGTMTGDIVLAGAPTENLHPATKNYVDTYADAIETALSGDIEGVEESLGILSDAVNFLIVSDATPTTGPRAGETLQSGDLWYSPSNGQFYVYYEYDTDEYYWVEVGGADENKDTAIGTNSHDFPAAAENGDLHKGYIYDSARNAWKIDRTSEISDNSDVNVSSPSNNEVLMYNSTTSVFENVAGIALNQEGFIPTSYIPSEVALVASVAGMTAKTTVQWSSDTSIPAEGSLNVELATELRIKIGNGVDTFADLEYVPSIGSVDTQIATAIADKADKAGPTFTGTVSLPSDTSIGDVSSTEIGYLDGVTSSVQTQLNTLSSDKAPIADPTFTGTVSGITKSMVDLGNVDNTSDADKPVSTAQQAALDTKLNLAGGTMTGKITLDGDPTQALHAVTKQYVDSVEAGLITRPSVVAATTVNLDGTYNNGTAGVGATLNLGALEELDIDGVTSWEQFDGILLKNQTNAAQNGRYVVLQVGQSGYDLEDIDWILRRCSLCDEADEIPGSYIFVLDGITNEQTGWVQHVADPATFTVGTDNISVYQFAGAGAVTAGTNISVSGSQVSVVDAPVFTGIVDASAAGVEFSDGVQTQAGVPSLTTFVEKTANYQLDTLDHKDNVVEMNMSTAGTFTVPLDATLAWPIGASVDIFATGTGAITIAPEAGVTLNATPGLTLRTQWSSATILKRGADNWVVYGDLKA
jgi:energy-converting hydrogenase Eha subunit B